MYQSHGTAFKTHPPEPNDSPFCLQCGNSLRLIRVEQVLGGCERHTLECPRCGRDEMVLVAPPARGTT